MALLVFISLQNLLAALAGLLALLSLPNTGSSRFPTCLRAAAMLAMLSLPRRHPTCGHACLNASELCGLGDWGLGLDSGCVLDVQWSRSIKSPIHECARRARRPRPWREWTCGWRWLPACCAAKSARRARWASRPSLAAEHVFLPLHFTTCLRAAKSARRARWASRPSLAAEHVFLSLHYLSPRCCHASQAPSPPSAWPRKAEPVLLRQPPGPAVASLGLSMLRPCLPFPPSAWLAEGRASASCASRPALAAASLGSSTLRPCRRHPFQTFRDLPGFVSVLSVHPSGPPSIITRAMDCMLLLPCNGLSAALTPNPPTVGGPPRGLKHQEGLVIPSSPRDKG